MPNQEISSNPLEAKVLMLESRLVALESRFESNSVDAWITLLTAKVNQLAQDLKNIQQDNVGICVESTTNSTPMGAAAIIPDGNSLHNTTSTQRCHTLEFRPVADEHKGELQIMNADSVALGDTCVPYMMSGGGEYAELLWAPILENGSVAQSLEVNASGKLQIYEFDSASPTGTVTHFMCRSSQQTVTYITLATLKTLLGI